MVAAGGDDSAVVEYARYLGIEPHEDAALMHIAREAIVAELPAGWEEHTDDNGNVFYFNEKEDRSMWEHPCDAHYRKLVLETRQDITADRPSKAAPGAQDMPLEFSTSISPVVTDTDSAAAVTKAFEAAVQPTTEVKALGPTTPGVVDADDKKYLNAIGSPEARCWWAENIGRKRVRTRQVAKLLAAWLVEHNALTEKASPLGAATSDVDEIVTNNSSTTREYARTIVTAMEKEEGRVSAGDFGTFVADRLQGNFSAASLRSFARKLQPRRSAGAKRRQQTSPVNSSVGQGARNYATHGNTLGTDAGMRAFEMSRDSRASAVLERQRASPIAAKYAAVATAGGPQDPNPAAGMAAPVVPAIHRELLAPLTGSESEPLSAKSIAVRSRGTRIGGDTGLTAPGVNSGSPVRLPSLESSPVLMNTSDLDGPDIEHLVVGGGSVNTLATSANSEVVSLRSGSNNGNSGGPVLVGQNGQRWSGNLTGSGGMTAGRWPARHKFSMKRTRQRSEKLQPVATGAAGSGALSMSATGAAAARGELGISEDIHIDSLIDNDGGDGSFEQAW